MAYTTDQLDDQKAAHYLCGGEEPGTAIIVQALIDDFLKHRPKTARGAAGHAMRALRKVAKRMGYSEQSLDHEIVLHTPEQSKRSRGSACYTLMWESGPYEWAIPASMALTTHSGGVCEPHYSFDLTFFDDNWKD